VNRAQVKTDKWPVMSMRGAGDWGGPVTPKISKCYKQQTGVCHMPKLKSRGDLRTWRQGPCPRKKLKNGYFKNRFWGKSKRYPFGWPCDYQEQRKKSAPRGGYGPHARLPRGRADRSGNIKTEGDPHFWCGWRWKIPSGGHHGSGDLGKKKNLGQEKNG